MRAPHALVIVALLLPGRAPLLAQDVPAAPPAPTPAAVPQRTLTLNLKDLVEFEQDRGHAEFDRGMRRGLWQDPMVRLEIGVAREEAAAMRGGLVGAPAPWSATGLLVTAPGADPHLILAGPFGSDWHELTPQEKVGRVAEQAVYLGLIVGILSGLR